jgi:hypothetical protein
MTQWGGVMKFHGIDFWIIIISSLAELVRRANWNIIRLENEHLNNVSEFRAVKDIPLPFETSKYSYKKDWLSRLFCSDAIVVDGLEEPYYQEINNSDVRDNSELNIIEIDTLKHKIQ